MQTLKQGRRQTVVHWGALALIAWPMASCTPIPTTNTDYNWPAVTTMAIWPVSPATTMVLGRNGNPMTIAWNVAVVPQTTPTVSLMLYPDPDLGDPNDGNNVLVTNLDTTVTQWPFSGRDANNVLVPAGTYRVRYTIDDGSVAASNKSEGTVIVPLRFTAPTADVTFSQSAGQTITWETEAFSSTIVRLDICLSVDPNDGNDLVFLNKNGMLFGDGSIDFEGTVYEPNNASEPNGHLVPPDVYYLRARVWPSSAQGPFFIPAGGRLIILPDP